MEGLENKLDGVHVGDLIRLHSPEFEVGGYVTNFDPKQVRLSHENPFSKITGLSSWNRGYRSTFTAGDRTYDLSVFKSYEVLKKHSTD